MRRAGLVRLITLEDKFDEGPMTKRTRRLKGFFRIMPWPKFWRVC